MNIGLINEYYPPFAPGGAQWSTLALAQALTDAGHSVTVVTPNYGQGGTRVQCEEGVHVVRFAFAVKLAPGQKSAPLRAHASPAFYLYSAWRIAQVARARSLEILHAQGAYSLPGTLWAARIVGTRAFFTLRDTSTICPITVCLLSHDYIPEDCRLSKYRRECLPEFEERYLSPISGLRRLGRKVRFEALWQDVLLRRACLNHLDGITAVSKGILDVYVRAKLVDPARCRVIYNIPPIGANVGDRGLAWRQRLGLEQRQVVLYVGKFSPGKGTKHLIEASTDVVQHLPDTVFLFAGKGLLPGSGRHIVNLGSLPHADVLDLYDLADVIVVPSVWPEPLSRVILEAMAAGRPVIVTDSGGSPEAVENDVTGLVVPRRDPGALSDAIVALLTDHPRRARMGQAAGKRLGEVFSREASVRHMIEFYQGVRT